MFLIWFVLFFLYISVYLPTQPKIPDKKQTNQHIGSNELKEVYKKNIAGNPMNKARIYYNNSITRLPASRSSSIGPKGYFLFLHPKVEGGGVRVSVDKNENHGLKIKCILSHFKPF